MLYFFVGCFITFFFESKMINNYSIIWCFYIKIDKITFKFILFTSGKYGFRNVLDNWVSDKFFKLLYTPIILAFLIFYNIWFFSLEVGILLYFHSVISKKSENYIDIIFIIISLLLLTNTLYIFCFHHHHACME